MDDWLKIGILYDKNEKYSPSNEEAIDKFRASFIEHKLCPITLSKNDIDSLSLLHGLFIRDTTHPENYTFQFAIQAEAFGIKCIDSVAAIMKGCNKVWQVQKFSNAGILYPFTQLVSLNNYFCDIDYPRVIKLSDSCFSQGVYLANNEWEYLDIVKKQINGNPHKKLVVQEFIKSSFDWRVTIFDRRILFVCKYYMVENDWKIVKYDRNGDHVEGKHETVSEKNIPTGLNETVLQCINILDKGLYGLDIKQVDNKFYVIEINDNPSIDAGIEDEVEGDKLYDKIVRYFKGNII